MLDAAALQRATLPHLRAFGSSGAPAEVSVRLEVLPEVGSTNDRAVAMAAEGAPEGSLVVAARQTGGRGRLGRGWASPEGGLYLSLVLRPDDAMLRRLPATLLAGVAVAEAADRFLSGARADLKWPNDVHVGGKKLAGILGELSKDARGHVLVLGVGINVATRLDQLPDDVRGLATSLSHLRGVRAGEEGAPSHADVLAAFLERFTAHWLSVKRGGGATILALASGRMPLLGKPVRVRLPGRVLEGTASGLSATGGLVVEVRGEDGQPRRETVLAGEVEEVRSA
jgi:BirA family biotin operon repressor/biotin-[acetyl-CoA-carboxylase] ligase